MIPQKTCLIIGYGRAGKRHKKDAEKFGLKVQIFDPMLGMDGWNQHTDKPDYVVIATPPANHLDYLRRFIDTDSKILCEKPLCGLGELEQAKEYLNHPNIDNVMVAYNWRYHPLIRLMTGKATHATLISKQTRTDMPHWGLLLDHVSHGIDILRTLTGDGLKLKGAQHFKFDGMSDNWDVAFDVGAIIEQISREDKARNVQLAIDNIELPLDPDSSMFDKMWERFLSDDFKGDYDKAILTQVLIEEVAKYDKVA